MSISVFLNNPITGKDQPFNIISKQLSKEVSNLKRGTTFFYDGGKYEIRYLKEHLGDYYIFIDPIIEKEFHIIQY